MIDLKTAPPILPRLPKEEGIKLLSEAITQKDWETLKPYPQLLLFYQKEIKEDIMDIAKWTSHYRTQKHKWCNENCNLFQGTQKEMND